MNNTEMKYRCVVKLNGQTIEDFVKNLFFAKDIEVIQITDDKMHAVVKMTDATAKATDDVLFQVA